MAEVQDVHLYGTVVGRMVRHGATTVTFESSDAGMARFGIGSRILSANLPLGPRPSTPEAATAFFGGLLPEGSGRSNLAKQAQASRDDVFALVSYAGRDVAGAIRVGGDPGEPAESYEALTDEQVAERLTLINDYALGAVGGGGSLAGYQPKTTLALLDGVWHAGVDGAASTHILKPVAGGNEGALHAEAFCLELARRIGLTTFASDVRTFAGRTVLVLERYDRRVSGRSVERIHQEDGAQALGLAWDTDSKFEGVNAAANLKNLAGLLRRRRDILGAGPDDRETLLAHTAFNTAIGNTDAHAKNFSTLRSPDGAVRLAPLYDVSTHALAPNGQLNMSLRINSRAYQPSLTIEDLVAEGVSWGLDERHAWRAVTGTLEELAHALEQADGSAVGEKVARYIDHGTRNLLDGKAAGIGGVHPSLVTLGPGPGSS
ncbi:type II toxin-antitoxin system HipA family toxin [Pseudarthrobacter raffinosi]|uniref:type II toxin-antitoxin system HipA family toxin n=1 Tax=Pseudarthrobacter raffinosi TaxID=2953651 RepID=UPI00208FB41E|nr:HipA domain-containing protein [Pseudarthrobacter sp. MDT3-28]MCO4236020.1 HipA domain-containing protein [Pseudarthrobacter sp. MDT3-28]